MRAKEFDHAVLAKDGLHFLNVDGRGLVDLHGLFAQCRSKPQRKGAVHDKNSKQSSDDKRKPGMLDEPHDQIQKRRKEQKVIGRRKRRPKESVLGANDSPQVAPLFRIIPKADFHSLYKNDSRGKLDARHYKRHKDNHKNIVRGAALVQAADESFDKAHRKKRERSKAVNRKPRPCQKAGVHPAPLRILDALKKFSVKKLDEPAQHRAGKKQKSGDDKYFVRSQRVVHS